MRVLSRLATSRTNSFSINPDGPTVPVSWPPCPASITTFCSFNPRLRINERSPLLVGLAGVIRGSLAETFAAGVADALAGGEAGFGAGAFDATEAAAGELAAGPVTS